MANVVINSTSERRLYEAKIIAQIEEMSFFNPLVGKENDKNAFIFRPGKMYQKGRYWTIPLRKAVTDDALEDGATYEGEEKATVISTTDIEINERGQPFGGFTKFEEMKTILDLREQHYEEASQWATQDFDLKFYSAAKLATASLPTRAARSTSQYNTEFIGDAASWAGIDATQTITAKSIARARKYFQSKRGLRPGQIAPGVMGFISILPSEATYQLSQEDEDFKAGLRNVLPRSADNPIFSGHGFNPWGWWDGVMIVEDSRPVYGGDYSTFLNVEQESTFIRFEGIFMGAQALAFAEWDPITWYERVWDYGRKFGVSVSRSFGTAKPVINLGTLLSASNRDYGLGYLCGAAPRVD